MIVLMGFNHVSAPISVREKISFNEVQSDDFITKIRCELPLIEMVLLSTCNRTELYFTVKATNYECCINQLFDHFKNFGKIDEDIKQYFYILKDDQVVRHLFRVVAGLDSLVLGEDQILSQAKNAYKHSTEKKMTGVVLNKLFHKAFEAGKKVRTNTEITRGSSSVSAAAVHFALSIFNDIRGKRILLIGAGETSELVLQTLINCKCSSVTIINRTLSKAEDLGKRYNGIALPYEMLEHAISDADIVLICIASPKYIVTRECLDRINTSREKPLYFIDISVPRVVEPVTLTPPGRIFIHNIDDLVKVASECVKNRQSAIAAAESLVQECVSEFYEWLNTQKLMPVIGIIKNSIGVLNASQLVYIRNKVLDSEFYQISRLLNVLERKYVGLLTRNIKALWQDEQNDEILNVVYRLFENVPNNGESSE